MKSTDLPPGTKTVVFATSNGHVRAVVPSDATVWRVKLEELLDDDVWSCSEDELRAAYPEYDPGAIPPFGGPEDVVIVDTTLSDRADLDGAGAWVADIQEPRRRC